MARICILTTSFPRSQDDEAGIFIGRLVNALSRLTSDVVVIVPRSGDEPEHEKAGAVQVVRYRYGVFLRGRLAFGSGMLPNVRANPLLILQLPLLLLQMVRSAFLRRDTFDIVSAQWFLSGIAAWMLSFVTKKPYLVTVRGSDMFFIRHGLLKPLCGAVFSRARAVTCVSENFRTAIIERFPGLGSKVCLLPNGVDIPDVDQQSLEAFKGSHPVMRKKVLLFVGTIEARKRIEHLIELLSVKVLHDFDLVLCGRTEDPSYFQRINSQVDRLGLRSRVHFEGPVSPALVPCYLKACRFYITASGFEGRPNSVLEAFAAGCIVVASNIPAHEEVVHDGENGFILDFSNLEIAAQKIAGIDHAGERHEAIRAAARSFAASRSWEHCAKDYLSLYGRILAK